MNLSINQLFYSTSPRASARWAVFIYWWVWRLYCQYLYLFLQVSYLYLQLTYFKNRVSFSENEITYSNSKLSFSQNSSSDLMNESFMSNHQFPALAACQSSASCIALLVKLQLKNKVFFLNNNSLAVWAATSAMPFTAFLGMMLICLAIICHWLNDLNGSYSLSTWAAQTTTSFGIAYQVYIFHIAFEKRKLYFMQHLLQFQKLAN